jgi:hypothetical protein
MNEVQKDILKVSAITGGVVLAVTEDPISAGIWAAGTALSMNAAYDAAAEEIAKITAQEASRVRAIPVSERR